MSETQTSFERLAAINVNKHVEKKAGMSYLSWSWAVDQLMRQDPSASWEYGENVLMPDGTMMVSCTVTAFGKPMKMHLPVMDNRNKPIVGPNAFQLNTSMMRCLVKAIALHGLGLYIYAGEDLPNDEGVEKEGLSERFILEAIADIHGAANADEARKIYAAAAKECNDAEDTLALARIKEAGLSKWKNAGK